MSFFCSIRGLCSIYRTEAGGHQDLDETDAYYNNYHWLPFFDAASGAGMENIDEAKPANASESSCGPSNYVLYYDAASLYPSSGK